MENNYQIAINGFTKGLNRDNSKFRFTSQNYYDCLNFRVITSDGLSTGSLETTRGTKISFTFPETIEHTYTEPDGTTVTVPQLGKFKILGGTSYESNVIIFTLGYDGDGNEYSQIWMFQYDEDSDTIVGTDPSTRTLVDDYANTYNNSGIVHLMYNRNLGFSLSNVIDAWVRVESDKFVRLYWVDGGLNQMRSLNLAPNPWTNLPINLEKIQNTPQSTIDIITSSKLNTPTINEILNGNLPNGKVCYFYRLISRDGAITTYSPTSNMVDLNAGNIFGDISEYPETGDNYIGTGSELTPDEERLENTSEKAIRVRFDNLDRNYDYIQPGYIIYTEPELPELFLFPERPFNKQEAYFELIHDGLEENIYPITLQEFTQISGVFEKPKTIQPKNNWMIVANTKASQFNLKDLYANFDTRAYSYNSAGEVYIADYEGTLETSFTGTNYPAINEYLDSINPNYSTYKYQKDGITLGGSGPYVSYSFVSGDLLADENYGYSSTIDGKDINLGAPFINTPVNSQGFDDLRSPYKSTVYASHARGEKYRYGLVGVDYEGRESFVEWIADIKIPDFDVYPLSVISGQSTYVKTVGIKFDINLPSDIRDNIREIKIVRVLRSEEHMTRLGTGITGGFCSYRPHKTTWNDVLDAISGFMSEFIVNRILRGMFGPLGYVIGLIPVVGTAYAGVIAAADDLIQKTIKQSLEVATSSLSTRFLVNADDIALRIMVQGAFLAVGNCIPVVGIVIGQMAYSMVGEQITDYLYNRIKEYIRIDVAGLGDSVYSLSNWNMHKEIADGYSPYEMSKGYSSIAGMNFGYVLSPIHQFDKYQFRYGDKLRIVGTFDQTSPGEYKKITQVYHRATKTGLFNRTESSAAIRKWYNPSYKNGPSGDLLDRIGITRTIEHQKTLDVGEIVNPPKGSGFPEGNILNAFIGMKERYKDDDSEFINKFFSRTPKVFGIGDKRHLIKVDDYFPESDSRGLVVLDQQSVDKSGTDAGQHNGVLLDVFTNPNSPTSLTGLTSAEDIKLLEPRTLDGPGDYMVSYERTLSNQYGGDGFANRALNNYVEVITISITEFDGSNNVSKNVYNGDTYVGLYGCTNYNYYFDKFPGYEQAIETKKALAEVFPVEVPFNFNLREGKHFLVSQDTNDLNQTERQIKRKIKRAKRKAKRVGLDLNEAIKLIVPQRFLFDEFIYSDVYHQSKTFKKFYPKPAIDIFTTSTTNRIWRSSPKIDGELIDSWRLFKPVDFIDVEGIYGSINRIAVLRDKLLFYQTNAFGSVVTNERSAITDNKGEILQMATSLPFSNYGYTSTETGAFHRNAVIPTNNAIYHVDVNKKKIFKYGEGLEPLSDVEGLTGFLRTNLVGDIVNTDTPLQGVGIHGEYYPEFNTVLFTALGGQTDFTVGYNLVLGAFESFHSFKPGIYIRTPNRLLTSDYTVQNNVGYEVFKGNYGEIFGSYVDSYIQVLTNGEKPYTIKNFDNLTLFTEVYNSAGTNLPLETINKIECINDYQTTGTIALTATASGNNNPTFNRIIRQERKWFLTIGRDTNASANTTISSRMRDFYQLTKLSFTNNANKKLILHDILTHYTVSQV